MENSTVDGGDVAIDDSISIVDTWKGMCLACIYVQMLIEPAMTKLPKSKARTIGVSNHTIEQVGTPFALMASANLHRSML